MTHPSPCGEAPPAQRPSLCPFEATVRDTHHKVEQLYHRLCVSNGAPSVIETQHDHDRRIRQLEELRDRAERLAAESESQTRSGWKGVAFQVVGTLAAAAAMQAAAWALSARFGATPPTRPTDAPAHAVSR